MIRCCFFQRFRCNGVLLPQVCRATLTGGKVSSGQRYRGTSPGGVCCGQRVLQDGLLIASRRLTAETPENGWLEDDPVSFWECLFSGAFAVS